MTRMLFPLSPLVTAVLAGWAITQPPVEHAPPRFELTLNGEASLSLTAAWDDIIDSTYKLHESHVQLQNFKPARVNETYTMEDFRAFLPAEPVAVGDSWTIDGGAAVKLLKQFHPGATSTLHHGSGAAPGAWACLRAIGPKHAEILIRMHAEFVLAPPESEDGPCWLTPSQFAGRMVIDRQRGTVEAFHLQVPPINSNVDVNVPAGDALPDHPGAIIADIGFIPRMELSSDVASQDREIQYESAISEADAQRRLEQRFYPFAAIDWLSVPEALKKSQIDGIPMHLVILFGALQDESC